MVQGDKIAGEGHPSPAAEPEMAFVVVRRPLVVPTKEQGAGLLAVSGARGPRAALLALLEPDQDQVLVAVLVGRDRELICLGDAALIEKLKPELV